MAVPNKVRRSREVSTPYLDVKDWGEVYYALETKAKALEAGDYGSSDPDCNVEEWAAHLRDIMSRISAVVDV